MAKKKFQQIEMISPVYITKLKHQRRSLGMLQFKNTDDKNFTKWEDFTENLLISLFGEKSNQHSQFENLINYWRWKEKGITTVGDFKGKMKDLLTNFIEELELNLKTKSLQEKPSFIFSPKINLSATQIATQKINIDQTIETIIEKIKSEEPNKERVKEAEKELNDFREEIKKKILNGQE